MSKTDLEGGSAEAAVSGVAAPGLEASEVESPEAPTSEAPQRRRSSDGAEVGTAVRKDSVEEVLTSTTLWSASMTPPRDSDDQLASQDLYKSAISFG